MNGCKPIFLLSFLLVFVLSLPGCIHNDRIAVKAIYLAPENGGQLSGQELEKYPEIAVVHSFDDLKKSFRNNIAIWIDKDAISMVDIAWLHEESQKYSPLVLVGYNDALYSFREKLSGFGIEGPGVDWSQKILEPGFSVWMLKDKTDTSTSSFMKGYDLTPDAEQILSITNDLIDGRFPG